MVIVGLSIKLVLGMNSFRCLRLVVSRPTQDPTLFQEEQSEVEKSDDHESTTPATLNPES